MAELVESLVMLESWMCGPNVLLAALGFSELDLDAVDPVHTIDEQNQYENEGNLSLCEPPPAIMGTRAELPSFHIVALL